MLLLLLLLLLVLLLLLHNSTLPAPLRTVLSCMLRAVAL
jgi:hypothetical protein